MEHPTKDQLAQMRQQGMTAREIAGATGRNQGTIEYLFRKYKLCRRRSLVTLEQIEEFNRMKQEGRDIKEIAEKTGYTKETVRYHLKAEKAGSDNFEQEFPTQFAIQREPRVEKKVYYGIRYEDVTEFYIPT